MKKRIDWTALDSRLRQAWLQDGLTFREIADELQVTRSAVAGRINRLGLNGKGAHAAIGGRAGATGSKGKPVPRKPKSGRAKAPPAPAVAPVAPEQRGPACRWPIGDPRSPDFRFCTEPAVAGRPYCAEHCAVAYLSLGRKAGHQQDKGNGKAACREHEESVHG